MVWKLSGQSQAALSLVSGLPAPHRTVTLAEVVTLQWICGNFVSIGDVVLT